LVDARDFEEHRSPEPDVNADARETPTPGIEIPTAWPMLSSFPERSVTGYDYSEADQPLTVEVWCEWRDAGLLDLRRALRGTCAPPPSPAALEQMRELVRGELARDEARRLHDAVEAPAFH
jgi:hypothetical protein